MRSYWISIENLGEFEVTASLEDETTVLIDKIEQNGIVIDADLWFSSVANAVIEERTFQAAVALANAEEAEADIDDYISRRAA